MKAASTVFVCQSCGAKAPKWLGRCPDCAEWNSYVEEAYLPREVSAGAPRSAPVPIARADAEESAPRLSTGLPGLDRVLGGGLVPGSVVLLGGEPGIGKSTLLLQAAHAIAGREGEVLYVSGEESPGQVRLRAERLKIAAERLFVLAETDVSSIVAAAELRDPALLIVDSIQAVREPALSSSPGTVSQVRESAAVLHRYAKESGVPLVLIGHVTKDGSLAGPKALEHLVDVVITVEGERASPRRVLRAAKNRFGAVEELALYEMTSEGLREIGNPSAALLSERRAGAPGSAVTAAREGSRSVLVEVQALVGPAAAGSPRRVAIGLDGGRLALLLAVLEEAGIPVASREVFVSCAGGLEVTEPAADLAIVAAIISSAARQPAPEDAIFFGEIGLLGEVRQVPAAGSRIREAAALGFSRVYLPSGNAAEAAPFDELAIIPVGRISEIVSSLSRATVSRRGAGPTPSAG